MVQVVVFDTSNEVGIGIRIRAKLDVRGGARLEIVSSAGVAPVWYRNLLWRWIKSTLLMDLILLEQFQADFRTMILVLLVLLPVQMLTQLTS